MIFDRRRNEGVGKNPPPLFLAPPNRVLRTARGASNSVPHMAGMEAKDIDAV